MRSRAGSMDTALSKKSNNTNNSKGNSVLFQKNNKKNGSNASPARKDHRGRPLQQDHRRRSLSPLACIVRPGTPGSSSRCKTPTSTAAIHPNLRDSDQCRHRGDNASVGSSLSVRDQFDIYLPRILPGSRSQKYLPSSLTNGTNDANKLAEDDISSITTNEYLKYGGFLSHVRHWTSCGACEQSCHGSTPVEEEEEEALPPQAQAPLVKTTPVYQPKKQPIIANKKNQAPSGKTEQEANKKTVPSPLPTSAGQEVAEDAPVSCLPFDLCIMSSSANKPDSATVDTTKGSHETAGTSHEDVALARNSSLFDDALGEDEENKQKRKWRLSLPWNRKGAGTPSPAGSPSRIQHRGNPASPARSKGKKQ